MANSISKVYLDVCALCRPFDDQSIIRNRIETDAISIIFESVREKKYQMIISSVHLMEVDAIEEIWLRYEIKTLLNTLGVKKSSRDENMHIRAEVLFTHGLGVADSAHIAIAEETADLFITCDDKLIKKCHTIKIKIPVMNPIEFCVKENLI